MLNLVRICFDNDEDIIGSQGICAGFLIIYELFTGTKEVVCPITRASPLFGCVLQSSLHPPHNAK